MEPKTKVIFRVWGAWGVIALFPEEDADNNGHCLSYMRTGQHGGADYYHIISSSRPAKPEESAELREELEKIGYNLEERKRYNRKK